MGKLKLETVVEEIEDERAASMRKWSCTGYQTNEPINRTPTPDSEGYRIFMAQIRKRRMGYKD
jgi:hypothetical protein